MPEQVWFVGMRMPSGSGHGIEVVVDIDKTDAEKAFVVLKVGTELLKSWVEGPCRAVPIGIEGPWTFCAHPSQAEFEKVCPVCSPKEGGKMSADDFGYSCPLCGGWMRLGMDHACSTGQGRVVSGPLVPQPPITYILTPFVDLHESCRKSLADEELKIAEQFRQNKDLQHRNSELLETRRNLAAQAKCAREDLAIEREAFHNEMRRLKAELAEIRAARQPSMQCGHPVRDDQGTLLYYCAQHGEGHDGPHTNSSHVPILDESKANIIGWVD